MQNRFKRALLYLPLVVFVFIEGCKKDNTLGTSSLSFKLNGIQYAFSGDAVTSNSKGVAIIQDFGTTNTPFHYTLYSYDGGAGTGKAFLHLAILPLSNNTQLAVGTYTKSNFPCDMQLGGKTYTVVKTSVVTITATSGTRYTGSFSAAVQDISSNTVSVTEGTFQNLAFIP